MRFNASFASSPLAAGLVVTLLAASGCAPKGGTTSPTGSGAESTSPSATATRPLPTAPGNVVTGDTIRIGLVASQNGALVPWGMDSVRGAQLAVEEFQRQNPDGIRGKRIQLLIGDSGSDPVQGKSAAEKLISDGVIGIVGEVASGITAQIAASAFEKGIPVIAIGATRTDLTEGKGNVFRVCYTDDFQGPVMATFAYEELNLRRMAIMTDIRQPYSQGLSQSFREHFTKLGGEIVDEQNYNSQDTQFAGQIANIKAKNPDGLFLSGYFTEVGQIARQAREAGLNVPLLGGDGWDSQDLITAGGQAIQGGFFCNHYNNLEERPEVQEFLRKWRAKYGRDPATTMGALSYDAMMLMLDALKRAKELDSRSLIEAIEATENFPGVSGSITLKGMNGNPPKRALVVMVGPRGQEFIKAYETTDIAR